MTLLEAITARHSVRKYLDKEIPADTERDEGIHRNAVVWFFQRSKELYCDGW